MRNSPKLFQICRTGALLALMPLCAFAAKTTSTTASSYGANSFFNSLYWNNGAPASGMGDTLFMSHSLRIDSSTFNWTGTKTTINSGGLVNGYAANAISGGSFTINSDGWVRANTANAISGGSFTINSGGLVNGYAANAISGGSFTLNSGGLVIGNTANAISGGSFTLKSGGGVYGYAANAISGGSFTLNSGGLVYGNSSKSLTGSANFNIAYGGVLVDRYGDSTGFTASGGGLIIRAGGASSGHGELNQPIDLSFSNAIKSGASLTLNSGGRLKSNVANAISGGSFTLNSGGLVIGSKANAISGGGFTIKSGGLVYGNISGSLTGSANFNIAYGGVLVDRYGDSTGFTASGGGLIIRAGGASSGYGELNQTINLNFSNAIKSGASLTLNSDGLVYGDIANAISGGSFTLNSGGKVYGNKTNAISGGSFTLNSGGTVYGSAASAISGGSFTLKSGGLVNGVSSGSLTGTATFNIAYGGVLVDRYGTSTGFTASGSGLIIRAGGASSGHGELNQTINLNFSNAIKNGASLTLNSGGEVNGNVANAISGGSFTLNSGGTVYGYVANAISGGSFTLNSGGTVYGYADNAISGGSFTLNGTGTLDLDSYAATINKLSGSGRVTRTTGTLTLDQSTNTTFSGTISGTDAFTKKGTGVLTLNHGSGSVFTEAAPVIIEKGSLLMGNNHQAPMSDITLHGGTLSTGSTTGYSQTFGTLTVTAPSTINLGSGSHTVTFADSSAKNWTHTLKVTGWEGTASGGTAGKIEFQNQGLTPAQRSTTQWVVGGNTYVGANFVGTTNQIVPILFPDKPGSSLAGSGTTLVMQFVKDSGIGIWAPVSVPFPNQTVISTGTQATIPATVETYEWGIYDIRGSNSPLSVSATVNPLTLSGSVRNLTVSVEAVTGDTSGWSVFTITTSGGSASGTLMSGTAMVNRAVEGRIRINAHAVYGASALAGTWTGSIVMTVN